MIYTLGTLIYECFYFMYFIATSYNWLRWQIYQLRVSAGCLSGLEKLLPIKSLKFNSLKLASNAPTDV